MPMKLYFLYSGDETCQPLIPLLIFGGYRMSQSKVTTGKEELIQALSQTDDKQERTTLFHNWIKSQNDDVKLFYQINWVIPHSVFNVSCTYFDSSVLQNIDWFQIHKTRDTGKWSHQK